MLVNNAASFYAGYFEELTPEQMERQITTSLIGPMNVTRAVLPVMREQRSGHVVTISSSAGFAGFEYGTAYAASKFGVDGWMESLAPEVEPFGIHTTVVNPGFFRTELLTKESTNYAPASIEDYAERNAAQREFWESMNGRQGGDPAKLAQALLTIADQEQPPFRFIAGADAIAQAEDKLAEREQQIDALPRPVVIARARRGHVMKHISLGGLDVSRLGLGTMAMSGYYLDPSSSDAESIRTIQRALELGVTHIDTAEIYGPYANEELVGRAIKGRRDDVVRGDEVRPGLALRRRPRSARQQPGEHPHRGRGLLEAAADRPHRPLLPAPGRPEHAHRRDRRRPGRAGGRGKGPARRPVRGRAGNDPPRPRRAPDRRATDRVLPVDP